jgi:hypothetical protein
MIELPDFEKRFDYENNFYLTTNESRISKIMAHYELFKKTINLPGNIVECGVFKGCSLLRFIMFRNMFGDQSKKIIGFDIFDKFPETEFEPDKILRSKFINDAGMNSISKEQLEQIFKINNFKNTELIEGDVCQTIPNYIKDNPQLKISILNLDTDIYEPALCILEYLWDKIVKGGILILDDYGVFPGETKAVDEFFNNKIKINKIPFSTPFSYIIKE